jgi:tripartite-type tricarboxylate transporter receptor subunit TctC
MSMKHHIKIALAAATLVAATGASAQAYPAAGKTIRFVIGFPAGSTIDNVSRVVLDNIRTRTGATLIIENKPGALGVLGVETVAKAAADGYTMMPASSATHSSGPYLSKAAQRFDALNGFTHVGRVVRFDVVVVTSAAQGYQTAGQLIAAAKANPTAVSYGYGSGTGQVVAAAFSRAAKIQVLGVPYKGQPPALTDLIGGQVSFVAADLGAVLSQVRAKNLTAVALVSDKRSTILSDVPTAKEVGLGGLNLTGWIGVAGPAKLPPEVVQWWTTQLNTAMAAPEVNERLRNMGVEPDLLTGEPFQRFVKEQHEAWGQQIREAGIQPE